MPTIIDSLIIKLGLDSKEFGAGKKNVDKGLKETGNEAEQTGKKLNKAGEDGAKGFNSLSKEAVKFLAVIGGTIAIKRFIEQTVQSEASLYRLGQNLGENVSTISAWSQAAEQAGGSAEGLQGTMDMLSKAGTQFQLTGESSLIPFFSALKVAFLDAKGNMRSANDLFLDLSDRVSKMDRTKANNILRMMGIDQGTANLILKPRKELELIIERQKQSTAVTKKQAEEGARLNATLIKGKQSFEAFGREILSEATPAIEKILDVLSSLGEWMKENQPFIKTFLTVLAVGLTAVGAASVPVDIMAVAIAALAGAIALLYDDYQTWKRGGDSFIDWNKWKPGIEAAGQAIHWLRDLIEDLMLRALAAGDAIWQLFHGDFTAAKIAFDEMVAGTGTKYGHSGDVAPVPGASNAMRGAGASAAQSNTTNSSSQNTTSVQNHVGEININTSATDAEGIFRDANKATDYLFGSQANYGLA